MELQTTILNQRTIDGFYDYILQETIFMISGGGQLEDVGAIDDIPVISCFEENGVIYHRLNQPLTKPQVTIKIDDRHRFISKQGHSAQHLISAMFKRYYQLETVSHHYTKEGSYIDLQTTTSDTIDLNFIENKCNEAIREARAITISYPSEERLSQMTLAHPIPDKEKIRIVSIEGIEHNPCMGTHVDNTSEIQMIIIDEMVQMKDHLRIFYRFGNVILEKMHLYTTILTKQSTMLSKPVEAVMEGLEAKLHQQQQLKQKLHGLEEEYAQNLFNQLYIQPMNLWSLSIQSEVKQQLLQLLLTKTQSEGILMDCRKVAIYSTKKQAKQIAALIEGFRGGGNEILCQGVLSVDYTSENLHEMLQRGGYFL